MDIGSRIRNARKAAGLSQEELARRAGMSVKGMSYIERGHIEDPHYSSLAKIAGALDVSVGELVENAPLEDLDELRKELEKEVKRRADLLPLPQKVQEMLGQEPRTWTPEDKRNLRALIIARRAYQIAIERLETETEREPV